MDKYIPRMKKLHKEKIAPELMKEFSYSSVMQVPTIQKVSVSAGVGEAINNKKMVGVPAREL